MIAMSRIGLGGAALGNLFEAVDDDAGALRAEAARDGEPDAAWGPGHHGARAGELHGAMLRLRHARGRRVP